jgi:hypothetical protein
MKLRILLPLLIACGAVAPVRADDAAAPADAPAATVQLPKIALTTQLLHQFLVAEFAIHRGQMALAVSAYRDLANETRDPRVARRAVEVALFARQYDVALEAARLWAATDPTSQSAKQMLNSLLAADGRTD